MGVTGARTTTSDLAGPLVAAPSAPCPGPASTCPVGVGLGVSNGDQAAEVASYADGVIVGSAFVRTLLDHPDDRAAGLRALRRAHRGPRGGRPPCLRGASPLDPHRLLATRLLAASRRCCSAPAGGGGAASTAQLQRPGARPAASTSPTTPLTDTDGDAVLAGRRHRHAADAGLLRLHPLPRHLPGRADQPGLGDDPARRRRPRPGRGGLRDHATRPATTAEALRSLPRPASTRASSALTGDLDDIAEVGESIAVGVTDGEKLPSGGYDVNAHTTQVIGHRRRRRGAGLLGPGARRRRSSPPTSTPSSRGASRGVLVAAGPVDPQPRRGHLAPRPGAAPRLRAVHHRRHRGRHLDRRAPLGGPRRPRRRHPGPRRLGGALRPGRRPALPRGHRREPLLRRGRQPRGRRSTSGGAAWGSGARIALGAVGVVVGAAAQGHPAAAGARRPGPRRARRPGAGPLGQLVQPGALRPAHRPALGPGDRPGALAARARLRAGHDLPPHVPLRVAVEPGGLRGAGLGSTGASGSATAGCSRST